MFCLISRDNHVFCFESQKFLAEIFPKSDVFGVIQYFRGIFFLLDRENRCYRGSVE